MVHCTCEWLLWAPHPVSVCRTSDQHSNLFQSGLSGGRDLFLKFHLGAHFDFCQICRKPVWGSDQLFAKGCDVAAGIDAAGASNDWTDQLLCV